MSAAQQRKSRKAISERNIRTIATPEGVSLRVELAERGDRAGAVMIDLLLLFLSLIVSFIAIFALSGWTELSRLGSIIWMLLAFFIRNFYFMFFELKWQGQTPGKRRMKIKVIDRFGRPLTSDAIFARNMMREIEIFIPMGIFLSGGGAGIGGWMQFFAFVWACVLVFLPMFNKDNLRAGDLIAGTLVVREPQVILAKDMMEKGEESVAQDNATYVFSARQLDAYGIFELQTLEALLRNTSLEGRDKRRTAGETIIRKIGWPDPVSPGQMDEFLSCYYHALRKRLEGQLLMGKRKEDKFDAGDKGSA